MITCPAMYPGRILITVEILIGVFECNHYGSVLSDIDFLESADIRKNKESPMPFTVSLTGYQSIPRYIESALSPTASKYVPANAAFRT